jgi:SAM-dependent methyltransferase
MSVFEYYDSHPQAAATFHAAMSNWSKWDTPDIIEAYDFSRFKKVVDLGGGNGAFLSALLNRYSNLSGILLDRPMGVEAARAGLGGPLPRCEIVAGDFLADVPKGADLYTIKHVLDAWQDEDVVKLFSNCRTSMADGGRVVVLESVIEPGNNPSLIKWLDLMMMTVADGGKFRSEPDFPPLFADAGLRLNQVVRISDSVTLLEGVAA